MREGGCEHVGGMDAGGHRLGLDHVADRDVVLDLARDVAHGVAGPAAPLTTYLAGLAVGAGPAAPLTTYLAGLAVGAGPAAPLTTYLAGLAVGAGQDASDVAAHITRLAAGWAPQE